MFSRRFYFIAAAFAAFLTLAPLAARAQAPVNERLRVDYKVSYHLGLLKLMDVAKVRLSLREETYTPKNSPPKFQPIPVLVLEISVMPPSADAENLKKNRRVWFSNHYLTVSDLSTFRILHYEKRIHEDIDLPVVRSQKNYIEQVDYEPSKAMVHREDFNAGTREDSEVDLTKFKPDAPAGGEVFDLTSLMGRALFQPDYFHALRDHKGPMQAQVVTKTRLYQFTFHTESDKVKSSLTGKVRATKVESDVIFRTLKNEVVPFEAWLTEPTDLSPELAQKLLAARLYSFPTAFKLKFTVGSLRVTADSFEAATAGEPPPVSAPVAQP